MSRKVDQEDPFSGRGSYQEGRDNGATENPGKILSGMHGCIVEKVGKVCQTNL